MLLRLYIAAMWSPEGKGLTSWLLFVMFIVILLVSHFVSCDRCGTWLYRFLIPVVFLTYKMLFEPHILPFFRNSFNKFNKTWALMLEPPYPTKVSNITFTGPCSAVGNVSGYRCMSDCRSRGREFDPSPVPYFRGDWSGNNFYVHSPPFHLIIQLSVTSESMRTKYWLTSLGRLVHGKMRSGELTVSSWP